MLSRRQAIAGTLAAATAMAMPVLSIPALAKPMLNGPEARKWMLEFAAEFARHVDWKSAPDKMAMWQWITAEATGAFEGLDDPLSVDPREEAREAIYCISIT